MIWPWRKEPGRSAAQPEGARVGVSGELLASLAAALPDPALVLDRQGIVLLSNQKLHEILGRDFSGHHISSAIRSPAILEAVAGVLAGGQAQRVDYTLRSTAERHFDAFVAAIGSPQTDPSVLILLRDLTREQQIERMRADFVANASHELRTPLASLLGFIETLQGPARDDEKARGRFLELMRVQAQRMKRLIDDLLSLSRIEMNVHLRPSAKVDLGKVARHVRDSLAELAREAGCEIEVAIGGELPVAGDWDELVQVVQNLVENAIKYAASGKRVEILGACHNEQVELAVRDHGPGIAEEHLPRLTERFYRVSVQESRLRGGTGLGLAIVKHILNRHRGKLTIRSVLGQGSSFTIAIPLFGTAA